ncbi:MAG: hypothetical protein JSS29_13310 [Proteobacteria bacterium]|nr:hypothetical protein [Pseudomonadota bacterium]
MKAVVASTSSQRDLFAVSSATPARLAAISSGNPYARLANEEDVAPSAVTASRHEKGISKAAFEAGCRSIFRGYSPAAEQGALRQEHRDFITRNSDRAATMRLKILQILRRYDLTDLGAIQPQFNREHSRLTAKKLLEIEQSVVKDDQ